MTRLAGGVLVGLAALTSVGWYYMAAPGSDVAAEAQAPPEPPREQFAVGRVAEFDAGRAMEYLKELCKIGPRISGSEGMKKQQALLKKHFEECGGKVEF